jgi:hypothetical protein
MGLCRHPQGGITERDRVSSFIEGQGSVFASRLVWAVLTLCVCSRMACFRCFACCAILTW